MDNRMITGAVFIDLTRDFKIHYGEALVRLMQPKETGPTTPSPAKTQID